MVLIYYHIKTMGAKQSITVGKEDERKEDDNKSIDTVILDKNPIDISGVDIIPSSSQVNGVPIVDTVGCSCMKTTINTVDSPASEEIGCTDKTEAYTSFPASPPNATVLRTSALGSNTETIVKCECGNQCKCVPPCECKSPKSQNSSGSSFRLFTKTADLQDRFVSLQARLNKLDESFNDMGKRMNDMDERIVVLETLSKKMTEYVPLTAIPYCRNCETIVLNGRVCDCGLLVE